MSLKHEYLKVEGETRDGKYTVQYTCFKCGKNSTRIRPDGILSPVEGCSPKATSTKFAGKALTAIRQELARRELNEKADFESIPQAEPVAGS